ncbi:hypothetical protein CBR_g31942 [Chara braunii]|uniref:DUF659 domain-containing protein n=1 Tax=Chara braunii TaxID=69332 RepID=A0A388LG17_CHABU|nr:hypothetical protein CBR_g31942 [Chara braunii]|eukprot:GBG81270.1 hypothetical protein CBR_g31942 [Chara braunii]
MECKLCGWGFQGRQSKAAQHFTIKNNCAKVTKEQLAEIWNKTNYPFDQSHHRKIIDFLRSRRFRDNRNTSGREQAGEDYDDSEQERRAAEGGGDDSDSDSQDMDVWREAVRARGKMRGDKAVAEDSTPDEHDDDDDQGADLWASLDGGLMTAGRRGQEGAAKAMKDAVQSKKRKRKATTPAPPLPKKGKVLRQNFHDRDLRSGVATRVFERVPTVVVRERDSIRGGEEAGVPASEEAVARVSAVYTSCVAHAPSHFRRRYSTATRVVVEMVAAVRKDNAATRATILTDGRKSITSDQIVNFLAVGATGAYLFRTVQRDGAVQETAEVVVERWKDVFNNFGVENVNAICTDSASAYVAASKLLAKEEVKYSRITWLPYAVKKHNQLGFIKLARLVEISTNLRFSRCHGRGSGYVLPWEDAEEETEDNIPPPRDEGVRPADRVTEAQRERQVQRGQKDRLSKAPPSVETYFGRRATMLMPTELDAVYDPEPDPMAQDPMEAEPWSDPDDLAVESEPGDSDDGGDDVSLTEMLRPQTRASTASAAQHPPPPPPPPPSAHPSTASAAQHPPPPPPLPPSARASTAAAAQHPPPPPPPPSSGRAPTGTAAQHPPLPTNRPGHGEKGTREIVDERDDDDDDDREGYEGSNEDEDDPAYSLRRERGDDDDDDDEGGDGTQAASGLRRSYEHRADRCSGAGKGDSGAGRGVGGAGQTRGAGRGGGGRARRESASSTRTVHWVDEGAATGEVGARSAEFAAASAEAAAEAAPSAGEFAAASEKVAGGFAEVAGEAAQVGRASAQLGVSFSGILDVSLGLPPTPAGERGSGDAAATPVRGSSRDTRFVGAGGVCNRGRGDCRLEQERAPKSKQDRIDREERQRAHDLASRCEMTQSIASRARAERMLETGGGEGHRATDDAMLECGGAGTGDAGERPASPVQGVCILPIGEAMTAGELERQVREDPLQADRRGWMDEASRRFMAEGPAYVPCSPSLPSSSSGATTSIHIEGPVTGRITAPAPAESPSPKSRKKKMRAGKSLRTVRRVTHAMRETQPGLASLHPRTREALTLDVVAETVGWWERGSSRATEQPITAPTEAEMPCTGGRTTSRGEEAEHSGPPGRSMAERILGEDVRTVPAQRPSQAGVVLESGTDDLEMPRGQRRRVSVYDLLRAQHGVDAAPRGGVHASDTAHGPVDGTGDGDGVRGAVPHRRRKDIVNDDDV